MIGIDENTLLMLHGDSLEDSSQYKVGLTNSGVSVSAAQSKFGGKSLRFNGNSYIDLDSGALLPANGDFTVDWWEYRTSSKLSAGVYHELYAFGVGGILIGHGNGCFATSGTGTNWDIISGLAFGAQTLNTWVHCALVRKGATFYAFRNGQLTGTQESSASIGTRTAARIGAFGADCFEGYIDEFRISNVARWTESFNPPTEAYAEPVQITKKIEGLENDVPYYARVFPINFKECAQSEIGGQVVSAIPFAGDTNTLLLLHGDDLTDGSIYGVGLVNKGVSISAAQSKFGGKSLYFNGNSYIDLDSGPLLPAKGDFTVEWWEYRTSNDASISVYHEMYASGAGGILMGHGNGCFATSGTAGNWDILSAFSLGGIGLNTWVHYALVRKDNTFYAFKNGVKVGTKTSALSIGARKTARIGEWGSVRYQGYIDEFRISNVARWTENFTLPTEAY